MQERSADHQQLNIKPCVRGVARGNLFSRVKKREIERAKDEDSKGGLSSVLADKMKAEARKFTIVIVDVSTKVDDSKREIIVLHLPWSRPMIG